MGSAKSQKLSNTLLSQTEGYLKSHQVCWFLAEHSSSKEQPWPESRQSNFPGDSQMKYFLLASLLSIAVLLVACGAGHPRLTSIAVSPSSATAASSPQGQVGFTATGTFTDRTSRELHLADGLEWKSSNTVDATIDDTGEATCLAPGSVTITATAPADLQIAVSSAVQNTSPKVSGSAMLNCT